MRAGSGFFVRPLFGERAERRCEDEWVLNPVDTHRNRSRQMVLRYALVQLVATALVAVSGLALAGWTVFAAAWVGGAIATIGTVLFGWTLFQPGVAASNTLARALYRGEVAKWLWVGVALWLALSVARIEALPLIAGFIAAQVGFWLGLVWVKRP